MGSFHCKLLGVEAYVEYHYIAAEDSSDNSEGCNADAEIGTIIITQGRDSIRINSSELPDELYDELRNKAIKDAGA